MTAVNTKNDPQPATLKKSRREYRQMLASPDACEVLALRGGLALPAVAGEASGAPPSVVVSSAMHELPYRCGTMPSGARLPLRLVRILQPRKFHRSGARAPASLS